MTPSLLFLYEMSQMHESRVLKEFLEMRSGCMAYEQNHLHCTLSLYNL